MADFKLRGAMCITVDLIDESHERILELCELLIVGGRFVLHGSNVKPSLSLLEPRQANDSAKASGNQLAVYACVDVRAVLAYAILNRPYLLRRLESFTIGYRVTARGPLFKASGELYALIRARDPQVFSDGFVYALERNECTRAADSAWEFFSTRPLTPKGILKVPASLGEYLFRVHGDDATHTIAPYTTGSVSDRQ